jgi:hypothetical protein
MRRKAMWTTALTVVAWAALYAVIEGGIVTHEDIKGLAPFD